MLRQLKNAFLLLLFLSITTGLLYPLLITGLSQWWFADKANGQIRSHGSILLGQYFNRPDYFWGRPSATSPFPNNGAASSGSNLAPSNPALIKAMQDRADTLKKYTQSTQPIPIDLLTASGSGLDPDISPAAAYYQADRVAQYRKIPLLTVQKLIAAHTHNRLWGFLGEPTVNVLLLNESLDAPKS